MAATSIVKGHGTERIPMSVNNKIILNMDGKIMQAKGK